MALKIVWTSEAVSQLDAILEYLERHWTHREIQNFVSALEAGIQSIKNKLFRHKISLRKTETREFQVTKHVSLFYEVESDVITILLLWSNRMNPEDLQKS